MASAAEKYVTPGREYAAAAPAHFSLLLARLAVLAATAGKANAAPDGESLCAVLESEILPVVDKGQLGKLRAVMSGSGYCGFLHGYLLDVEFHLEEIVRARGVNDFSRLARTANILVHTAADVGAMRTSAAARRLDEACRAGNYRQTGPLISALSQSCAESEMELRGVLATQARRPGTV